MAREPVFRTVHWLRRNWREADGLAAVEFAMIAPVFLLLLIGMLDMGHIGYAKTILNGAVQNAARTATFEGTNTTTADTFVRDSIRPVMPGATVTSTRVNYFDFADIGRPERFTDSNHNSDCDPGEPYVDENRSGDWEPDVGGSGNGGANDVVVYKVTVSYIPIFRAPFFPESWARRTMTATAVRKNQPFANQVTAGSAAGTC